MSIGDILFESGKKIFNIIPQNVSFLIFHKIFKIFDYLWSKQNNLIIFSGSYGGKFTDNSKFLFKKFVEYYNNELEIVWITCNKQLIEKIKPDYSEQFRVVFQYSLEGLITLLRAKVVFYVMGEEDIPFVSFSRKTITVQLWHGIPFKTIGNLEPVTENFFSSAIRYLDKPMITYWICSSTIDRNTTALCVGMPIDRVVITGYPRNDYLIDHKFSGSQEILKRYPFFTKKIILYAPTFRATKKAKFFPFSDFSIDAITTLLEKNDAYLLIRGHWGDDVYEKNGKLDYKSLTVGKRIITANHNDFEDVQELLPFVDILITDYSGIWIDFLLLEKPIIFVPYDLEEYRRERGLLYDYNTFTPGPKVLTNKDFIDAIHMYIQNPDKDSDRRTCIKKIFHEHEDGLSYKRIYNLIKE
jgi:CDP-glycerol glycerophosphotransferase (TagB/SpsB family)